MVNILYTINYLTNGGPTRVLENLVNAIDKKQYRITVLTLLNKNNVEIVHKMEKQGVKVIELNYNKNPFKILVNMNNIIKIINEINADIIHTHGIVTSFIVANKKIKAKLITTIHNNIHEDYRFTYGRISGYFIAEAYIKLLKRFDNVICCSKTSYMQLKHRLNNVSYIINGVDVDMPRLSARNEIRKELGIKEDDIVYVFAGVLKDIKRVIELVDMFCDDLKDNEYLLIIGDGPNKEKIERVNNEHIKIIGYKENVIDYLVASDIYVSYSMSEGFSISIIEALSCKLLCFLSEIPSHIECFEIDNNYYIGEKFNCKTFKYKKKRISENVKNSDKNNIKKFQDTYLSAKAMTKKYEEYYFI